jgi:hypothetical protein
MKKLNDLRQELAQKTLTAQQLETLKGGACDRRRRVTVNASSTGAFNVQVTMP